MVQIGDLVKHEPGGSVVESILQKLSMDKIEPDFSIGLIVDKTKKRMLIFSSEIRGLFWYDNTELKSII